MPYDPTRHRIGEASPQTEPERFTREEILAEIKHLLRTNKRYGTHELRTLAIVKLINHLNSREETNE